ncbi:sensor histidine kinase [Traorella massiliensis]|uniref:sensor histidine kinase n=1 Tax=Traorella massiliensis TaxID=1903263 RepID=UPI00248F4509|nr:sensor histidine kinase [Traorella massiliensis]
MTLFFKYMYQHRKTIFFYFLFSVIFLVIFWLYRLPLDAVGYAFLICTFIGSIGALIDFWHFYKQHRTLVDLQKRVMLSIDELPEATNQSEEDYQKLIKVIHQDKIDLITQKDHDYEEMMEYYTLWAHQIKTPIAAMRLLLSDKEESECEEELFKIEQYVEMVLTYLKVDHQGNDFQFEFVDIDSCIKQCIRKYAKLFIRKKLQLNYEARSLQVLTDEKWLCFVIEQLLSNAIKYTPSGYVNIEVKDEMLIIEDSGIGIQKEDLPRVFEKGFTGYNGRKDKKSSGIGLYLVKQVCNRLGHKISIESELGKYTCVMIDLRHIDLEVE